MQPKAILEKLNQAGFEAYYVGGCVRDSLLGRPIHDWDITTSALPEQVQELFSHTVPTGIRHGTVTVIEDGTQAEVTTFRTESGYLDGRHPEKVLFVSSLEEDLSRRDFTINAMAMDGGGRLTDLFGGQRDLQDKIIRTVGQAEKRFSEDALRMLRAYRFSAQLGFSIEPQTENAIYAEGWRCKNLSRERVAEETEKTLLSPHPEILQEMIEAGLLAACGVMACGDLSALTKLPAEREVRWAGFCLLVPETKPENFRLPRKLGKLATAAAAAYLPQRSRLAWKSLIAEKGWETAKVAAALCHSDAVLEIERSGEPVTLRQLALRGEDVPGEKCACGQVLSQLLAYVLEHPEENKREVLVKLAQKWQQRK